MMKCSSAIVLPLLAGLLLQACAAGARHRLPAGVTAHEISVAGLERRYLLYAPRDAASFAGPRPLVVVLHGGGGTADGIVRETGKTFAALADADGFYVVYPDAIDRMWDFGSGEVSEALERRIDDRAYFQALLDTLNTELPIDPRRVFATGISRGGQASYFIACNFPGRIRAIAPITMPLPRFMLEICTSSPPLGVAILNGTADPLVPYDGGEITVGRRKRGEVLSTDETVAFWLSRNGCDAESPDVERIDPADDDMHVDKSAWRDCRGAPVVLYRIVGGGHTWPSGSQYLPAFVVGGVTRDIDGAAEAWAFFRQFE